MRLVGQIEIAYDEFRRGYSISFRGGGQFLCELSFRKFYFVLCNTCTCAWTNCKKWRDSHISCTYSVIFRFLTRLLLLEAIVLPLLAELALWLRRLCIFFVIPLLNRFLLIKNQLKIQNFLYLPDSLDPHDW